MVYAEGLTGGADAKHTLTLASAEGYTILSFEYATIHTGLDTPVHEEDNIRIPATSSQFDYQGNWQDKWDVSPKIPLVSQLREPVDGNASVSINIIGPFSLITEHREVTDYFPTLPADRVHLRHRRGGPSSVETYMYPNWTTSIDGGPGQESRTGPIDLTPGG